MKNSPFQFLEPFDKNDTSKYHGRDSKVNRLYNLLFRSNLVVLFGPSGSGKTSLIDCGLRKKLDPYEWIPIRIRRDKNFNLSIRKALQEVIGTKEFDDPRLLIEKINSKFIVTPCLILDQFEELFVEKEEIANVRLKDYIEDRDEEVRELIATIRDLSSLNCKIIISIREEFLGDLDDFERYIPTIYDFKLRLLDPLIIVIDEILTKSFDQFWINQTAVTKENPYQPANILSEKIRIERNQKIKDALKSGVTAQKIHLPFLQIYLDRLYHKKFTKIYGDNLPEKFDSEFLEKHRLEFREEDIVEFGDIERVLITFIDEIDAELVREIDDLDELVHRNSIIKFLRIFTIRKGYKRPIRGEFKESKHLILEKDVISEINNKIWRSNDGDRTMAISAIIKKLIESRILKDDGAGSFELAHDIIARIIYDRQIDEDLFDYVKDEFESSYKTYTSRERRKEYLLGKDQVSKFKSDIHKIIGDDLEKKKFWSLSLEKAERNKLWLAILISLLTLLAFTSVFAIAQFIKANKGQKEATTAKNIAENATEEVKVALKEVERQKGLVEDALEKAEELRLLAEENLKEAQRQEELARLALQKAEEQEKIAIIQRDSARLAREEALRQTKIAQIALDSASIARDRALKYAKDLARQTEIADSLRIVAQRNAYIAQSSVLSFESKTAADPNEKKFKALQAYYLNKVYNGEKWISELTEALMLADSANMGVSKVKNQPEIIDFIIRKQAIIFLTAQGDIRKLEAGKVTIVKQWTDDFFFKRNSLVYHELENTIDFQDQNATVYTLDADTFNEVPKRKIGTEKGKSFDQMEIDIRPNGVYLRRILLQGFKQNEAIYATALSTDAHYLALGTHKGWLYVIDLQSEKTIYSGQYHLEGSRISDIAFDSETAFIATSGLDGNIKVNKIGDLTIRPPTVIGHAIWINCIEFLSNDSLIAGTNDGRIIEYSLNQNMIARKICSDLDTTNLSRNPTNAAKADSLLSVDCLQIPKNE